MIFRSKQTRGVLLAFTLLISSVLLQAQNTHVGNNSFSSNTYGPMVCRTDSNNAYSRHAYIYPAASLGDLQHGDTITQIDFFKYGFVTYSGNPTFRMYLAMSDTTDFGSGNLMSWSDSVAETGVLKVFDGGVSGIVDASQGYKGFLLDTAFVYDTSMGKHLKMFVEFIQTTRQASGALPVWAYESGVTVPAFVSPNGSKFNFNWGTPADTTRFSDTRKPSIRIYHARHDTSASIEKIYCLGELAILMNPVDSIHVRVKNTGKKDLINHGFELSITGANSFKDTVYVDTLKTFAETMIHFTDYNPSKRGTDSVQVRSINDNYAVDDTSLIRRKINYNVLSHNSPFINNPGGIGFNGGTGDFVAKFYTDSNYINQIQIGFTTSGLNFQLGIWDEGTNGRPGNELYMSDTLVTNGGQYIQPILPKVHVKGGYFVGIRQISTSNISFTYEPETPVRENVFFFTAPAGNTAWTPFAPGFDYNMDIQPRIQATHDVSVLRITNPQALDTLEFNQFDSIAPKATIINYGVKDENNPFDVICEARDQFGNVIYKNTQVITLDADDSVVVTFDKTLSLGNYGDITLDVYTQLPTDLATENDTLTTNFSIYVNYDIQVESFFDPIEGNDYELNKDKIPPTVRMVNFGIKDQKGIWVTSRVRQGNNIAGEQTQVIALDGKGSMILSFDSITIPFLGQAVFEVFCWKAIDSFPINDTLRVNVNVVRSNDIGILSITRPKDSSIYYRKQTFTPFVNYRNFGLADQDSVEITAVIWNTNNTVLYRDTITSQLNKLSTRQAIFKGFTAPDSAQTLYFKAKTWIEGDQYTINDSLTHTFFIRTEKDIYARKIVKPNLDDIYTLNSVVTPRLEIENVGTGIAPKDAKVRVKITGPQGQLLHHDSTLTTKDLASDELDTVNFAKNFTFTEVGTYNVLYIVELDGDDERRNDTIQLDFDVFYSRSFELTQIISPIDNESLELNIDSVKPQFEVRNNGVDSASTPVYYTIDIKDQGGEMVFGYNDSIISLLKDETKVVTAPTFYVPGAPGLYTLTVTLSSAEDQDLTDNEITHSFRVNLENDVRPSSFFYPKVDSLLLANRSHAPQAYCKNDGDSDQTSAFSVSYIISRDGSMLYNSNRSILINAGDSQLVTFDKTFRPTVPGTYDMTVITRLGTDQVKTNDTLTASFEVDFHESVEDIRITNIKVFPNPTSGVVSVESKDVNITGIRLTDGLGREVEISTQQELTHHYKLDVSELPGQMYWMEIQTEVGNKWVKLMVLD